MLAPFAQSPIAFNAWAAIRSSLSKTLDMKAREAISLIVSEVNGCNYWRGRAIRATRNEIVSLGDVSL
jgi:hypothetical protein